jgi:membrane associated rhomboid family serine protease
MATLFSEITSRYRAASIPVKFIWLNVTVFVALRLVEVGAKLFMGGSLLALYLETPSSLYVLAHRPWTVLTYMFVHVDVLHILFNMLWIYWFGKIFMQFFTGRQFGGIYFLGGIAGAALYLLCFNTLPYLRRSVEFSYLCGASASVMAIVFAVAFSHKNYTINLLLLGQMKLIWLAVGVLAIDVLAITSENAGGHIAHIGGALSGILFATQLRRGKDLTRSINRFIDRFVNFISGIPKLKSNSFFRKSNTKMQTEKGGAYTYRRPETDDEYRRRRNEETRVIDNILDKLKRSGYESLSEEEKKRLFDASKK